MPRQAVPNARTGSSDPPVPSAHHRGDLAEAQSGRSLRLRALLAVSGLSLLLCATLVPSGATATQTPGLSCESSWELVQSLLKRHISFRGLDTELRARAIDAYLEQIDPSKTLFLSSEIKDLRRQLQGVFFDLQSGECGTLDQIQIDLVKRYERMEEDVRKFVSSEDYALDTDVRLILDPDKRGHPIDDAGRKGLLERLVHFQMSNYLSSDMEVEKAQEKLIHRYELMTKRAREFEARDTYGHFVNAFAGALDPHSAYYPPEADEDFQIQMSLSLDGIGVALSSKDGYSVVERIIPGGATDKADALEPGDKIIAVTQDGDEPVDIIDMSLRDVVAMIRGKRGTKVKLTVLRKSDTTERFEVAIVRDKVTIEDAAATLEFHEVEIAGQPRKLAVIDLPTFYGDPDPSKRQSFRDVRRLLQEARDADAAGVLLDLSRNGGGKLDSSIDIAGLFIPQGGIVAVKNVISQVQVYPDPDPAIIYDGPLVILTSRITASASEIVAGALQDYGRAVIVGDDHTFGKGTVQSYVNQPGGLGALKVTTNLFFRPGGASTQHAGVAADVVLPSIFATDDLGERYTPYSLKGQQIPPFLGETARFPGFSPVTSSDPAWTPLSDEIFQELRGRSAERIASDEAFLEISEQLAKFEAEDDVIHLAELIREREEAEGEGEGEEEPNPAEIHESGEASPAEKSETNSKSEEESATPSPDAEEAADAKDEPTPQRLEALRILSDLVEIQETPLPSWRVPQSASRSEPPSSRP